VTTAQREAVGTRGGYVLEKRAFARSFAGEGSVTAPGADLPKSFDETALRFSGATSAAPSKWL